MKKLLLLLFSVIISFNSYGETLVCSYVNSSNEVESWKFIREGNFFKHVNYDWNVDIYNEDDEYLTLIKNLKTALNITHINKKTNKFSTTVVFDDMPSLISDLGKCEFIY